MLHSTALRNALAGALAFDGGSIRVLTGPAPLTADAAETGTLLLTITLPTPAYGAASAGVLTQQGLPLSGSVVATGTPGYVRHCAAGDTFGSSTTTQRMQYSIGTANAEFITNTLAWVNGGTVDISGSTYTANL